MRIFCSVEEEAEQEMGGQGEQEEDEEEEQKFEKKEQAEEEGAPTFSSSFENLSPSGGFMGLCSSSPTLAPAAPTVPAQSSEVSMYPLSPSTSRISRSAVSLVLGKTKAPSASLPAEKLPTRRSMVRCCSYVFGNEGGDGGGGGEAVSDMLVVIGLVDRWEWESTNMSSSSSLLDPSSVKGGGEGGILILLLLEHGAL